MRVVWTRPAIAIRRAIYDRIRIDEPAAAKRVVARLRKRAQALLILPNQGRKGRMEGTFELVVSNTPYLLIFERTPDCFRILTFLHHSQQWPPAEMQGDR